MHTFIFDTAIGNTVTDYGLEVLIKYLILLNRHKVDNYQGHMALSLLELFIAWDLCADLTLADSS